MVGLDDEIAEPRAGRDRQEQLVGAPLGRIRLREQRLVRSEPRLALGLPRAGRHAHPLELGGERSPAGLVDLLLEREPLLLLLEPRRVVAFPRDPMTPVELEDPAGHVVEEVAIVRDRDDRAGVLLQEVLEPRNRLRVEVVGGLVEQQQIGVTEEQAAERDAAALATGERGDVGVAGRKPQRVHRDLERAVEVPRVHGVDLVLELTLLRDQLVEVGVGLPHRRAHRLEAREEIARLGDAVGDVAEHVLGGIEGRFLLEETDRETGSEAGLAGVPVVLAGHDPQQRRLARAIGAEHPDLGARVHRDVDSAQHLAIGRVETRAVCASCR